MTHIHAADLVTTAVLSFAVATTAMTITKSKVFAPLRSAVSNRSEWFGELIICPYCTSHWLAFAAVAVYQPRLVHSGLIVLDLFITALVIVALASMLAGMIFRSIAGMH